MWQYNLWNSIEICWIIYLSTLKKYFSDNRIIIGKILLLFGIYLSYLGVYLIYISYYFF